MKFIKPYPKSLFNVSDSLAIKLLTKLRLGFSHLRKHKFNHNFHINPLCSCSLESKSTTYFFFYAVKTSRFTNLCKCLMKEPIKTDWYILTLDEKSFSKLLLYGDGRNGCKTNKSIILASINFIYSSKRFYEELM